MVPVTFPVEDGGEGLLSDQNVAWIDVLSSNGVTTHVVVVMDVNLLAGRDEALISAASQLWDRRRMLCVALRDIWWREMCKGKVEGICY